MKLTKVKLQQIIKEELENLVEDESSDIADNLISNMQRAKGSGQSNLFMKYMNMAVDIGRQYPKMKPRLGPEVQKMLSGISDEDMRELGMDKYFYRTTMKSLNR
jgi:hypothetical protein